MSRRAAVSGLHGLRSLHWRPGSTSWEHEVPYGGIGYFNSAGIETFNPEAVLGVEALEASALPDILPTANTGAWRTECVRALRRRVEVFGTQIIDRVDPMAATWTARMNGRSGGLADAHGGRT